MTKFASLFLGTALSAFGFAGPAWAGPVTCESISGVEVAGSDDAHANEAEICRIRSGDPFVGNATGLAAAPNLGSFSIRLSRFEATPHELILRP